MTTTPIEIIAAGSMIHLAQRVYQRLDQQRFGYMEVKDHVFPDGEMKPTIPEIVRHKEVYLFHPMYPNPNGNLVKAGLTINALTNASVEGITLVLPYLQYSRQDRIDTPGAPFSAKFVAQVLQLSPKLEHLVTMDLHVEQIEGLYDIPVENLYGAVVVAEHFRQLLQNNFEDVVVYSPDFGGAVRARRFAKMLGPEVRTFPIEKQHTDSEGKEILNFLGDPRGKIVIIYDDLIATGDSILNAAHEARERGAQRVYCAAPHGVFSKKKDSTITAEEKFHQAGIEIIITESIPRSEAYLQENKAWLTILPLDELFARVITEVSTVGGSVNRLIGRRE